MDRGLSGRITTKIRERTDPYEPACVRLCGCGRGRSCSQKDVSRGLHLHLPYR